MKVGNVPYYIQSNRGGGEVGSFSLREVYDKTRAVDSVLNNFDANKRKNSLDDLLDVLANTKVVLKPVEKGPGYYALHVEINQLMRAWVRNTVVEDRTFSGLHSKLQIATTKVDHLDSKIRVLIRDDEQTRT